MVSAEIVQPGNCSSPDKRNDNNNDKSTAGYYYGQNVRISVTCTQGGRKYMEDRSHIHVERNKIDRSKTDYIYVAVYDGHGGCEASDFAKIHLLKSITSQPEFSCSGPDEDILKAIRAGFVLCHNEMRKVVDTWNKTASGFTSTSGTTSSVAFIMNNKIYTGHVGDSGIVIGRFADMKNRKSGMESEPLTIDHKPDSPMELNRIRAAGGDVMSKAGVMRVVWQRPTRGHTGPVRRSTLTERIPFLAVARALGDLWSYNQDTDTFIVSPIPDVGVVPLDERVGLMVLGSDGLWNVVQPQTSIDLLHHQEWNVAAFPSFSSREWLQNHSRWLLRHALRGWGNLRADNITVVTVVFDPLQEANEQPAPHLVMNPNLPETEIEPALIKNSNSIIRVSPNGTSQLKGKELPLVYSGSMDAPLSAIIHSKAGGGKFYFIGPGFDNYRYETNNNLMSNRMAMFAAATSGGAGVGSATANQNTNQMEASYFNDAAKKDLSGLDASMGTTGEPPIKRKKSSTGGGGDSPGTSLMKSFARGTFPRFPKWGGFQVSSSTTPTSPSTPAPTTTMSTPGTTKPSSGASSPKRVNSTPLQNTSSSSSGEPGSISTPAGLKHRALLPDGSKPKYFCRKHGLSCEKVKKMNREHEIAKIKRKQQQQMSSGTTPPSLTTTSGSSTPASSLTTTSSPIDSTPKLKRTVTSLNGGDDNMANNNNDDDDDDEDMEESEEESALPSSTSSSSSSSAHFIPSSTPSTSSSNTPSNQTSATVNAPRIPTNAPSTPLLSTSSFPHLTAPASTSAMATTTGLQESGRLRTARKSPGMTPPSYHNTRNQQNRVTRSSGPATAVVSEDDDGVNRSPNKVIKSTSSSSSKSASSVALRSTTMAKRRPASSSSASSIPGRKPFRFMKKTRRLVKSMSKSTTNYTNASAKSTGNKLSTIHDSIATSSTPTPVPSLKTSHPPPLTSNQRQPQKTSNTQQETSKALAKSRRKISAPARIGGQQQLKATTNECATAVTEMQTSLAKTSITNESDQTSSRRRSARLAAPLTLDVAEATNQDSETLQAAETDNTTTTTLNSVKGRNRVQASSEFLRSNVSPRFLARSPIHKTAITTLPPSASTSSPNLKEQSATTTKTTKLSATSLSSVPSKPMAPSNSAAAAAVTYGGAGKLGKRKHASGSGGKTESIHKKHHSQLKSSDSDTAASQQPSGGGTPAKRSRIWNSVLSFFTNNSKESNSNSTATSNPSATTASTSK